MDRDCNKCVYSTRDGGCRKWTCEGTKTVDDIKADIVDEIKHQMITLYTDMISRYGADIIEAKSDAFDELKEWLEEHSK